MRLSDFDSERPHELLAQAPIEPRDAARLLVMSRETGQVSHQHVCDLPDLLRAGDLVVANRSRVLPARVHARLRGGGAAELLLLRRLSPGRWQALGPPARRLRPGDLATVTADLRLKVTAALPDGERAIQVETARADP